MKKFNSNRYSIIFSFILILAFSFLCNCSSSTGPAKVKEGLTAKEAEQLASSRALEILGNPSLISIETPKSGGGVNREGRLANGERGKWWFGYHEQGSIEGLIIETEGVLLASAIVSIDNLRGLQEILPDYIDSSEAIIKAEASGGKDLSEIETIIAVLAGEPSWPKTRPNRVAWVITYELKNSMIEIFYVDAYSGIFLGKG